MPDRPAPPPAPPAADGPPAAGSADDRLTAVEAEQRRQGGMLEQILDRLPGRGSAPAPGAPAPSAGGGGKSVAELVREGIDALEREKSAASETEANKKAREDHAARLAALEERSPAETAATPVGAFRAAVQRGFFGIDSPGK